MSKPLWRPDRRSLQEQLTGCINNRNQLLEAGKLSMPSAMGQMVITVSQALGKKSTTSKAEAARVYQALMDEAERIKEARLAAGEYADVLIRPGATEEQLDHDFADPDVAGMAFIGHGAINRFWTDNRSDYNWLWAAQHTGFLKTGRVEQMMCGHLPRLDTYSVPLGAFVVNDLEDLYAATGRLIDVPSGEDRSNLFTPVFPFSYGDLATDLDRLNVNYGKVPLLTGSVYIPVSPHNQLNYIQAV